MCVAHALRLEKSGPACQFYECRLRECVQLWGCSGSECRQHAASLFVSECSPSTLRHQQGRQVICVDGSFVLIAYELAWLVVGISHRVVDNPFAVHTVETAGSTANRAEAVSVMGDVY